MSGNENGDKTAPKGTEWEVVSLTASAYAAATGPEQLDLSHGSGNKSTEENKAESSRAIFMSSHFVFPPSQHENLPLEPEYDEIHDEKTSELDSSLLVEQKRVKTDKETGNNVNMEGSIPVEFPGIQISCEEGDSGADFENDVVDKEKSFCSSPEFSRFLSGTELDESDNIKGGYGTNLAVEPDSQSSYSESSDPEQSEKQHDNGSRPHKNWWKERALTLYSHAKEANTFWSIFVAAAVMGLVMLGHRWQQERWQAFHLKFPFGSSDERMSRMFGPLSWFKDVAVGGHRRGSLLRAGASGEL